MSDGQHRPNERSSATPPPLSSPRQHNKRRVVATVAAVIGVSGVGVALGILSSQHRARGPKLLVCLYSPYWED